MASWKVYNYNVKNVLGRKWKRGQVRFSVGDKDPQVLEVSRYDGRRLWLMGESIKTSINSPKSQEIPQTLRYTRLGQSKLFQKRTVSCNVCQGGWGPPPHLYNENSAHWTDTVHKERDLWTQNDVARPGLRLLCKPGESSHFSPPFKSHSTQDRNSSHPEQREGLTFLLLRC